ncbi:ROK family protein [Sphingomonas sp. HT-1]|uniref:ROK family protein n=1 Tax=unclassified Sphingomonas TaxID=196159 RepID=UPI0002D47A30|nr:MULTISPECIES: ROK family protein [unclassified Sphingomonas]KTF67963.1 fructokinase [Sphingomonas sp. WG]
MTSNLSIAGLELGGTKCVATLGSGPEDVRERHVIPTTDPVTTLAAIEAVLDGWTFDAIGIASFGPIELNPARPNFGSIVATTKPGWNDTDLTKRLAARYAKPLAIQTDVNGAALAEARWGASAGLSTHAYITIGTGVGVGLVANGRPIMGYAHGEAGHMRSARAPGDSFAGWCPYHGDCAEGLLSGPALAARFGRPGQDVADDAPEWDYFAHDLAALLHNLVVSLAPERIAIGGGVMTKRPQLFGAVREKLAGMINGYGALAGYCAELDTRVGPPGLGDMAGPLGAIAMGLEALDR